MRVAREREEEEAALQREAEEAALQREAEEAALQREAEEAALQREAEEAMQLADADVSRIVEGTGKHVKGAAAPSKGKKQARDDEGDAVAKASKSNCDSSAVPETDWAQVMQMKQQAGEKKTRSGVKKQAPPPSPGPSMGEASGSKRRRVAQPPHPAIKVPLDGGSRLGLEQDNLDSLDLDEQSHTAICMIQTERANIAFCRAMLHDLDLELICMEQEAIAGGGFDVGAELGNKE
ncbi:hypothetical protein AcV7_007205 [Taiwanofungus camphoratus]|nr:hypothetical protein AcV7_007205 [Antrodia cinnamomea]